MLRQVLAYALLASLLVATFAGLGLWCWLVMRESIAAARRTLARGRQARRAHSGPAWGSRGRGAVRWPQ
jgi:hypothetical protein